MNKQKENIPQRIVPPPGTGMLKRKYAYLILIGLCFLVYANSLQGEFISDDTAVIVKNPFVGYSQLYWARPTEFLHSLCYRIAKFNVFPYHLVNVMLHSVDVILIFIFLCLFFETEPSFFGAALFAVHPLHTEAVSWISGRPYLIITLFVLASFFLYYRATSAARESGKVNYRYYLLSLALISYFINENFSFFIFFPLVIILFDVTFDRWRWAWKLWAPFLLISALRVFLAKGAILERITSSPLQTGCAEILRNPVFYFIYSFFSYLLLFFWPARLTLYHEPVLFRYEFIVGGFIFLCLFVCFLPYLFKKAKPVFLGLGIFVLFLAPTYSPVPVAAVVAERYGYLPSLFLGILAAYVYAKYYKRQNGMKRVWVMVLFICIGAGFAVRTVARNEDWRNGSRFGRATLEASPESPRAHNSMGFIYVKENNFNMGIKEFILATKVAPRYFEPYNNLGSLFSDIGRNKEAIFYLEKALELNPKQPEVYFNLGSAYQRMFNIEAAITAYSKAVELRPGYAKAYDNLADIYSDLGDYSKAIEYYKKTVQSNPKFASAHFNLADLYFTVGEYSLAVRHCDKAKALGFTVPEEFLEQLKPYRK